jgi:predicted O-linked N-acetylglucosamine transferase (SPINDLY family)
MIIKENEMPVVEELDMNEVAQDQDLVDILPALQINNLKGNRQVKVLKHRPVRLQVSWKVAPLM